mmetsp:Transcript_3781/g.6658  ORF Transcript_3781/g.6658 Transcript_3781/m.6658 type:complete len:101 (-) Transcript_3781:812-1114(-)
MVQKVLVWNGVESQGGETGDEHGHMLLPPRYGNGYTGLHNETEADHNTLDLDLTSAEAQRSLAQTEYKPTMCDTSAVGARWCHYHDAASDSRCHLLRERV